MTRGSIDPRWQGVTENPAERRDSQIRSWVGQGRVRSINEIRPIVLALDPRGMGNEGMRIVRGIVDSIRERECSSSDEACRAPARQDLDRRGLVGLFGLAEEILEPLAVLHNQWCADPAVHGGKSTQPAGAS